MIRVASIAAPSPTQMPTDGRQSDTATLIARGTRRLLRALGFTSLTELPLPSGRRADVVALGREGTLLIVEVKSSIADFRADSKWQDYRLHCDQLYFAVTDAIPQDMLPADAGLILADAYGAEIVRHAPEHRLNGATRRSMLLRYAQCGADRLHSLVDPDLGGAWEF